jgi:hypothetical protein
LLFSLAELNAKSLIYGKIIDHTFWSSFGAKEYKLHTQFYLSKGQKWLKQKHSPQMN